MTPWLIESPICENILMKLENLSESLGLITCKFEPRLSCGLTLQIINQIKFLNS